MRAVEDAERHPAAALLVEVAAAGPPGRGAAHRPRAEAERDAHARVGQPGDGVVPQLHRAPDGADGAEDPAGDALVHLAHPRGAALQRQPGEFRRAMDLVRPHAVPSVAHPSSERLMVHTRARTGHLCDRSPAPRLDGAPAPTTQEFPCCVCSAGWS